MPAADGRIRSPPHPARLSARCATRAHVTSVLAEGGEERAARLTPRRVVAQVRGFREKVTRGQWQRRAVSALRDGDDEARAAARKELEALQTWAATLLGKLAK